MNEEPVWTKPGTLHLTVSLLIQNERFKGVSRDDVVGKLQLGAESHGTIGKAIAPMFQDVADSSRQLFCAEALLDAADTGSGNCQEAITLAVPGEFHWETEGTKVKAEFGDPWRWNNIQFRYFWFLHSNRDVSYHVSLQIDYQHRLRDYYALSVIQKVFFPSETPEPPNYHNLKVISSRGSEMNLTEFIVARFNAHFSNLCNQNKISLLTVSEDEFWSRLVQKKTNQKQHPGRCDDGSKSRGSWPPEYCRAAFLLQDAFFDYTLRERLDILGTLNNDLLNTDLSEMADCGRNSRRKWLRELVQTWNLDANSRPCDNCNERPEMTYDINSLTKLDSESEKKELALIFLSGYFQNIMDFFRQGDSEFEDGTDPLYPDDPTLDLHFLLYATPDAIFEVVRESRSLESGRKHIGSCPYLFLVHVTLFHNESLVRRFEELIKNLVLEVEEKTLNYRGWSQLKSSDIKKLLTRFHLERLKIFGEVEKYMHMNVFRYDTEQAFYIRAMATKGISERQQHWEMVLAKLHETVDGLHDLAQQDSDDRLNKIILTITVSSIFQVLFASTQALRAFSKSGKQIINDQIIDQNPVIIDNIDEFSIMAFCLLCLIALAFGIIWFFRIKIFTVVRDRWGTLRKTFK